MELRQRCYWDSDKSVEPVGPVSFIKQERSDSPKNVSPEPYFNIVKCEETELKLQMTDTQISKDSSDYNDGQSNLLRNVCVVVANFHLYLR